MWDTPYGALSMPGFDPHLVLAAAAVTLLASVVKGAVGFAMPMIMISGLASFLPAHTALAALILPTLVTNLIQSLRDGLPAALESVRDFRVLILTTCIMIALSAQLVPSIPQALLLAALGLPVVAFAASQLAGWQARFDARHRTRAELAAGLVGGFYGGLSGIWGPPLVALLVSLDVPRRQNMRIQGVVYLIGAAVLFAAHLGSGVLNRTTLPLSALLVLPALAGLWLGLRLQDRLDQQRFRRWTLVVLMLTGLNLVRRAAFS
ncbi:MAG: sulfite exporter TauE/SafE family protein [Rhodobacteraceae bacterium]|nr:sulfite exporter TauE/SafE family protein [Paracoccaceae bacterium]